MDIKKLKLKWVVIGIIAILVIVGIYLNPDRKQRKINSEINQIFLLNQSTLQNLKNDIVANKSCFGDDSLKNSLSQDCVVNLEKIKNNLKEGDKANFEKVEQFYSDNKQNLDENTKKLIEESIKLHLSKPYGDLMTTYDQYFTTYIEWHKFIIYINSVPGEKAMTKEDLSKTKSIAQRVLDADDKLKLAVNTLNDYLQVNFSQEFISATINQQQMMKK